MIHNTKCTMKEVLLSINVNFLKKVTLNAAMIG